MQDQATDFHGVQIGEPQVAQVAAPVRRAERITAIDSLRGFALLGILLMNIIAMGLYGPSYDNPTVTGGATGPDLWVWIAMHVLAEGKMRCLFSMVFGASTVLLLTRLDGRKDGADIYFRRTFWLMGFGILHAYLLWEGEILYPYALCGLLLYPFRNWAPGRLIRLGTILVAITAGFYVHETFDRREMIEKGKAAMQAATQGKKLTEEQEGDKKAYEGFLKRIRPTPEQLKKVNDRWRGNPWEVVKVRAEDVYPGHATPYYHYWNLDMWSMMFIGMGLLKSGVLSGKRSSSFYGMGALIGYGIGIPLNSTTAWLIVGSGFDPIVRGWTGTVYDIGRLSVALAHACVIYWLCANGRLKWLTDALGAVGQTALSNYVLQSVVTAFLFTGYGFKLFGRLHRHELYYVVAALWVVHLVVSPIWVRNFQFGPVEWCWRSLTYWKKQPMRIA